MTRVPDDVLGKVARQQADVFGRIRTGGLSPERFFRVTKQLLGTFFVVVAGRTWAAAVEAGGYLEDKKYISQDFTEGDLPPFPEAEREVEITLRQCGDTTTTQAWLDILDNNMASKNKLAHPLTALAIGYDERVKDELQDGSIFTTWTSPRTGHRWYLILGLDWEDGYPSYHPYLEVKRDDPRVKLKASCRATTIAK